MDNFQPLVLKVRRQIFLTVLAENIVVVGLWWLAHNFLHLPLIFVAPVIAIIALLLIGVIMNTSTTYALAPLEALWKTILHLAPGSRQIVPPKIESLKAGRELITTLTAQIHQLVTQAEHPLMQNAGSSLGDFLARNLPLPYAVLDEQQNLLFANELFASYIGQTTDDIQGQNIYSLLDMSFPSNATYDKWFTETAANSATATHYWERVRLNVTSTQPTKYFDMAAYYNKGNTDHFETMLVLFDHTEEYSQDDQAVSFMALSVHELRTPLTLLRGYIEVFEDELGDSLSPELKDFMYKMNATAQQLNAFVSNILNVARVDDDQLVLRLHEDDWSKVLTTAVQTMQLRASVRGIQLECQVAPGLPAVAIDSVSVQEVVNNLIDNAIKYSGRSKTIAIESHLNKEGMVETAVTDHGDGMSAGIVQNLFTKFYRDHKNRAQIGGTGLGLYLCKSIVNAHGGNIWVRTKEGEGSTFSFTLLPYGRLSDDQKGGDGDIVRSAHGWIKNHSLYRR